MATLQVKSMDDNLYKALGIRAQMENRSISQEVIAIVKDYLSRPTTHHESATESYLELCGTWIDEKSDKQIADDIRDNRNDFSNRFSDIF